MIDKEIMICFICKHFRTDRDIAERIYKAATLRGEVPYYERLYQDYRREYGL